MGHKRRKLEVQGKPLCLSALHTLLSAFSGTTRELAHNRVAFAGRAQNLSQPKSVRRSRRHRLTQYLCGPGEEASDGVAALRRGFNATTQVCWERRVTAAAHRSCRSGFWRCIVPKRLELDESASISLQASSSQNTEYTFKSLPTHLLAKTFQYLDRDGLIYTSEVPTGSIMGRDMLLVPRGGLKSQVCRSARTGEKLCSPR